jgi:Zn-dependent protease
VTQTHDYTFGQPGEDPPATVLEWIDGLNQPWTIELRPERITLRGEHGLIELPQAAWFKDIYIAQHGGGFVVRFQTFENEAGFLVSAAQAQALLDHLGAVSRAVARPEEIVEDTGAARAPLLWPKVSPLAVWALISSALVFLPVVGLLPTIATIILLILHRVKVRKTRANSHSRAICVAAFAFLTVGLCVSGLATVGMIVNVSRLGEGDYANAPQPAPRVGVENRGPRLTTVAGFSPILAESWWEREHNWGMIAAGLVVILLSLSVHECGHAISAWWLGDDLARQMGRVTLKPLAHIDPLGTVILPLILFLTSDFMFGWAKPVPVRVENTRHPRRAHILISLAGPGANLFLASASFTLLLGIGCVVSLTTPEAEVSNFAFPAFSEPVKASGFLLAPVLSPLCTVLQLSFFLNVFLACFNLIPIPPLDGSWVLERLFPRTLGPLYARIRPFGFILFLILIGTDMFHYLLWPVFFVLGPGIALLALATGFS